MPTFRFRRANLKSNANVGKYDFIISQKHLSFVLNYKISLLLQTQKRFNYPDMKKYLSNIYKTGLTAAIAISTAIAAGASDLEPIAFGNFNEWVTRNITESHIIGGKTRQVYEIAPTRTIDGDEPYINQGGSPWATSNVMAKVCGITKTSNAVYPDIRDRNNRCARLTTCLENCKAIGIINIDVVVAGTVFLGRMFEPIKSTSDPYSKMEMGIPFTKRPSALVYDYKLYIPANGTRLYSSGFGSKKTLPGSDKSEVFVYLQRRWEDKDGNIYAKRVGTGRELLAKTTPDWVNGHRLEIHYGDISKAPYFKSFMNLIPESKSYCAVNSKGKIVPVKEVGWDSADATPTHIMVMFSAGSGEPYTGTIGTEFRIDNVALEYK